ncbi:hypothetical protein A2291_03330 [candidate division WOR-1 bacterium RIFOXYB2_FULL_42_35]|uniref:Protein kinase domain-containing protein n=1 Tax=candidate division WOR-1 bacterium RIFOXYC2_FULL_41_25 TaxID=1802586 RepID=A0A1F4TRZ4_UNCSA|nr:MAG: hypothetical protein A2247_02605 [candidate division WOR-1 bacterium RIFOXYA2_FULL_41_14]OGC25773.1 MAG: hypothetical protein A2291_03330 [candidate division WOR-1 bacterium RIFOXYB2_FULL_42_35]OGC35407.1 MAG: hypothetical protein A2462_02560 [candidate division WOR-1 bacterium RIFOXYC2_FULL_41_25]OGC42439.1 MAG: hypothetical protein A2548_01910 [candidate division WOR-1 bacterium RIFOXYD2_FULL_41_8]
MVGVFLDPNYRFGSQGRYIIKKKLGEGGCAPVFRAMDTKAIKKGRSPFVALKVVRRDEGFRTQSLRRESVVYALTSDRALPELRGAGEWNEYEYIAMEVLAGKSLREVLYAAARGRVKFPIYKVILTALSLCRVISLFDKKDIVFDDLSPQGVMFQGYRLRIFDFGLCVARNETFANAAKLRYLSPYKIKRERANLQSTMFVLGIMIWEMITGRQLFVAQKNEDIVNQILRKPIPSLTQSVLEHFGVTERDQDGDRNNEITELSIALDRIVQKLLKRSIQEAFSTMEEVEDGLRACFGLAVSLSPLEPEFVIPMEIDGREESYIF